MPASTRDSPRLQPAGCPPGLVDRYLRNGRLHLRSTYADKEAIEALGDRWDRDERHWYAPPTKDWTAFHQWLPSPGASRHAMPNEFTQKLAHYYLL